MKVGSFSLACAILLLACAPSSTDINKEKRSDGNLLTAEEWQENIEIVAEVLKSNHPDPFAYSDESEFDRRLRILGEKLDLLDDHEVLIGLIAAVASIEDGHTAIRGGFSFLSGQYPFKFYAFSDGLFVTAANDAHQSLVGARLVSIGGVSSKEALDRVVGITPHENAMTQLERAPAFLSLPEALDALGLASSLERAEFVFRQPDGSEYAVEAVPVSLEDRIYWSGDAAPSDRPLHRQRRGRNYWSEYLEDAGVLYVQFNRVRNDKDQSISDFAAERATFEAKYAPRCVFLDIRDNGGGNGYFNPPVVEWVANSPSARQGRFFVAIGRATFSAAQKLATALELETGAVFVGEPTGSRPNHFGDSESFQLPHGDLTLSVSSLYWEDAGTEDSRDALEPDIAVSAASEDYFTFTDPVLNAVIARCR